MKVLIRFTDGTEETVSCERMVINESAQLLKLRTSHSMAYYETWKNYPMVNIKSWETL